MGGAATSRIPAHLKGELECVLISKAQLRRRVRELAQRITREFTGRDLVVVSVLNGTVLFLADLIRQVPLALRLDFIGVSSYRGRTAPGALVFTKALRLDVRHRDVLLVDDILDTGQTLRCVLARLKRLRPRRIRVCVLLKKRTQRAARVRAHYVGFEIPDRFVVGYGLDFAERYRNLPFVGVLRSDLCHGDPS